MCKCRRKDGVDEREDIGIGMVVTITEKVAILCNNAFPI